MKLLEKLLEPNIVDSLDVDRCMFSVIYPQVIQIRLHEDMPHEFARKAFRAEPNAGPRNGK